MERTNTTQANNWLSRIERTIHNLGTSNQMNPDTYCMQREEQTLIFGYITHLTKCLKKTKSQVSQNKAVGVRCSLMYYLFTLPPPSVYHPLSTTRCKDLAMAGCPRT